MDLAKLGLERGISAISAIQGVLLPALTIAILRQAEEIYLVGENHIYRMSRRRNRSSVCLGAEIQSWNPLTHKRFLIQNGFSDESGRRESMGRYLLLWLLGVPIPILVLIWAFGGLH
jgi:hypothetical protein